MINPSEVGKSGEMVRLRTLESIWIQGKLRMWGRWSYKEIRSDETRARSVLP